MSDFRNYLNKQLEDSEFAAEYKAMLEEAIMTVKELKDKLNQFPDNLIVMIPNERLYLSNKPVWYVTADNVTRGCNEVDCCLFIDHYTEKD